MFLAIDRVSKFTYVEFRDDAGKMNGADFLQGVVAAFPYAIHTVLTDNGMAFADLPKNRGRYPAIEAIFGGHIFDRVCKEHGIQHRSRAGHRLAVSARSVGAGYPYLGMARHTAHLPAT